MIIIAEISHSLLGTYRRTCNLVGVDVTKIFDNDVRITDKIENLVQCAHVYTSML